MDNAGIKASRRYRQRQRERLARLTEGHNAILAKLDGNDKPLAVELRAISTAALGGSAS